MGGVRSRLKSSYDDIISTVDDFFDQLGPSTITPMEQVYRPQGRILKKKKLHLVTFHESILTYERFD